MEKIILLTKLLILLTFFYFFFNSGLTAFFPVSRCDHYVHFKRIVKAFLINAIDDTFLSSLYGK